MKSSSTLLQTLRVILGYARVACLLGMIIAPFTAVVPAMPLYIGTAKVQFDPTPVGELTQDFHPVSGKVTLQSLYGVVSIHSKAGSEALAAVNRQAVAPTLFVTYLLWFSVAHLLWRLCRNAETGQVFVEDNLKLLRHLGLWIIVCSVLASATRNWEVNHLTEFVRQHVTFSGLSFAPQHTATGWARIAEYGVTISATQLITGLLVFALAEVFRQGLALKRESELTV